MVPGCKDIDIIKWEVGASSQYLSENTNLHVWFRMSGIGGGEMREDEVSTDIKMVARSYRYMRRKPTILSYQPPKGNLLPGARIQYLI